MNSSTCPRLGATLALLLLSAPAFAQPAAPPPPPPGPPPGAPPPSPPPAAQPAPVMPPPGAATPPPGAAPAAQAAANQAPAAAPAAPPPVKWYEKFVLEGFVDAYFNVNFNFPVPQTGGNGFRAYDVTNGAALHWVGLNVSYPAEPVGGTVSLRIGPSAKLYAGSDADIHLDNIKQAYATWKPGGKDGTFTIDVGKFDGPYGAEVADTQYNMNYTRTMLNFYGQPFFFTGFRFDWAPVPQFDAKLILANGWNTSADNNAGKSAGVQFTWKPADQFAVSLGYTFGPEQPDTFKLTCDPGTAFDAATGTCKPAIGAPGGSGTVQDGGANKRFRHFVDLILDINPTKSFRILFNADYARDEVPVAAGTNTAVSWYGGNLGLRYAFNDNFAAAVRSEIYWDPNGFTTATGKSVRVVDNTLTLEMKPTSNLIFKLEGRVDYANGPFFQKGLSNTSNLQGTTTLGVVATTN